jgi:hypothetical protein
MKDYKVYFPKYNFLTIIDEKRNFMKKITEKKITVMLTGNITLRNPKRK